MCVPCGACGPLQISKLPKEGCAICLDEYKPKHKIRRLPCLCVRPLCPTAFPQVNPRFLFYEVVSQTQQECSFISYGVRSLKPQAVPGNGACLHHPPEGQ